MTEPISKPIAGLMATPRTPVVTFDADGLRAEPALLHDLDPYGEVIWTADEFAGVDAHPFAATLSQLICNVEDAGCWEWSNPEVTGIWLDDDAGEEYVAVTLCLKNGLCLTEPSIRHETICPQDERGLDGVITALAAIIYAAQQLYDQWCAVRAGIIEAATAATGSAQRNPQA